MDQWIPVTRGPTSDGALGSNDGSGGDMGDEAAVLHDTSTVVSVERIAGAFAKNNRTHRVCSGFRRNACSGNGDDDFQDGAAGTPGVAIVFAGNTRNSRISTV